MSLEDKITELLEHVKGLSQAASEEDPVEFYKNAATVAKSKGLPEPDGKSIKFFSGASVVRGDQVSEDDVTLSKEDIQKARSKYPRKSDDYRPTSEEMALINSLSNVDLSAEELYAYPATGLLTSEADRSADIPQPKAKASAAKMMPDKPIQLNHSHSVEKSVGKTFSAGVKSGNLEMKFYVLDIPENALLNKNIQAGIINKMSVSFGMDPMDYVCSSCSKSMYSMACTHWPGGTDEKGQAVYGLLKDIKDYYETSLVGVPAVATAGIRRSVDDETNITQKSLTTNTLEKNNEVGRIPSDKPEGVLLVADPNTNPLAPEVTASDVTQPVVDAAAVTAPVVDTPEAVSKDAEVLASLNEAIKNLVTATEGLKSTLSNVADATKAHGEVLKALVDSANAQSAIIEKAYKTAQDNVALKVASTQMTQILSPVDIATKSGLFEGIGRAVNPNFKAE